MKKALMILALLATGMCARSQVDTLQIGEREPTFYYWDTNWWDYYHLKFAPTNQPYNCVDWLDFNPTPFNTHSCKVEYARWCYTDKPLKIIGVAAPIIIAKANANTVDTTMKGRLPEYFRLYDIDSIYGDSMIFKAEARWDTFTPRYVMTTGVYYKWVYDYTTHTGEYKKYKGLAPVYEAYFDTAVTVNDSFYVSGTGNNNYCIDQEVVTRAHIETNYISVACPSDPNPRWRHKHELIRCKSHLCDSANQMFCDTLHWFDYYLGSQASWFSMFAIIDTSHASVVVNDTCNVPTDFRLINGNDDCVTFGWNPSGSNRWEISIVDLGGVTPDTTLTTHTITFASFDGFQQHHTYEARVRSVCSYDGGSTYYSDWSDSIMFHLNASGDVILGEDSTGTIRIETTVDRYTYLMPNPASETVTVASSFRIGDVEVYDLNGKMLIRQKVDGLQTALDISSLTSGTYIVRITTNNGTAYKKLVVK